VNGDKMAIFLGVDTGGTYTDAVLLEDETRVLAKAKSLTTRHDLSVGIGGAVRAVLAESGVDPAEVALASLSTTLATNALVEGQGGRVALVSIGFAEADLSRAGLGEALKGDPLIRIAGGHNHAGSEAAKLDLAALEAALPTIGAVSGFAVAGQFATRNPAHEIAVRDFLIERTGKPVSCSHDLSARLNGPKRAMTAVLNARLIGMIDHLITAAESLLAECAIAAPLMVVRGDGALISAAMARLRPIETILSGPAASIVGARWLTGASHAIVSDIGGTTTDIAVLRDGRPAIDPLGARVGPFRTMVEAVAMRTWGLGGDSEVHAKRDGLSGGLTLGPRRVMAIALAGHTWPDLIHPELDRQLASDRMGDHDGRFAMRVLGRDRSADGLAERDARLLERLDTTGAPSPVGAIIASRMDLSSLDRLVARGLVMLSGVTPTDAAHVLGKQEGWDAQASDKALRLFSRQRTGAGERLAAGAEPLAHLILDQLTAQTAEALLTVALDEDGNDWEGDDPARLARHVLMRRGMAHHRGLVALDAGLNLPLIGLGASAPTYYGPVGAMLSTETILPEHAGVANALGAVVGQVRMRASGTVTSPAEGRFRVHLETGPLDFGSEAEALATLEETLAAEALAAARKAGAEDPKVSMARDIRRSEIEGREVFVEAMLTATASGRPRIADG
jgi:N-methylhydantoinase A/oxoprolinase/acetone carboxylase beta subunit